LINAFNPQRLILGGGVIEGLPGLIERVKNYVDQQALRVTVEQLQVVSAQLQGEAGVVGAAAWVHRLAAKKGEG
jgi:glucokinase